MMDLFVQAAPIWKNAQTVKNHVKVVTPYLAGYMDRCEDIRHTRRNEGAFMGEGKETIERNFGTAKSIMA